MKTPLKIGIIGLDTSHVVAFTELLNDPSREYHVKGGRVIAAFPGGSPDFELSHSRVEGFTRELSKNFGVHIMDSPEKVAESCDAILLESVDGRVHPEQFRRIAPYKKPVFIDKPFAVSHGDAREIIKLAEKFGIPCMSCSSLRYAERLTALLQDQTRGNIFGADFYGPMTLQKTQPGLFWYGIHTVEMLYATLGQSCVSVKTVSNEDHDLVVGVWKDGRVGTVRGNRKGNTLFGGVIHREKGSQFVDVQTHSKPNYASLLERVMELFATGKVPVNPLETMEIIRFIEAANASRRLKKEVKL